MNKALAAIVFAVIAAPSWAQMTPEGLWRNIDDKTGDAKAEIRIQANGAGVLTGVLEKRLAKDAKPSAGDAESAEQDSFVQGLLDCPHYTRPEQFNGEAVPPVLLSGNHADIQRWRLQQSLGRTWLRRPDLLAGRDFTKEESGLLATFQKEQDPITKE